MLTARLLTNIVIYYYQKVNNIGNNQLIRFLQFVEGLVAVMDEIINNQKQRDYRSRMNLMRFVTLGGRLKGPGLFSG